MEKARYTDEIIYKGRLLGLSSADEHIIRGLDFQLYSSKYDIFSNNTDDGVFKECNYTSKIRLNKKWYADQVKQFYYDIIEPDLDNRSIVVEGIPGNKQVIELKKYKPIVLFINKTIFNGSRAVDILREYLWEDIIEYYKAQSKVIILGCNELIYRYLGMLPYGVHLLMQYNEGVHDIYPACLNPASRGINKLYNLDVNYDKGKHIESIDIYNIENNNIEIPFYINKDNISIYELKKNNEVVSSLCDILNIELIQGEKRNIVGLHYIDWDLLDGGNSGWLEIELEE